MNKRISILALLALLLIAGTANAEPYLIHWGWGGHNTPDYLGKNAAKIEAIRPFDGLIVNSKVMYSILQNKPVSYDRMLQEFKPINKNAVYASALT